MKLHLGVIDIPYDHTDKGTTTGDVAEILEAKYHPMEIFYALHQQQIADDVAGGVEGVLETLMMTGKVQDLEVALQGACSKIDERFKDFLSNKEMESIGVPGVPTKAALAGKTSRKKRKKGSPRPSFIDTGLYQASFKSWVDDGR